MRCWIETTYYFLESQTPYQASFHMAVEEDKYNCKFLRVIKVTSRASQSLTLRFVASFSKAKQRIHILESSVPSQLLQMY